MTVSTIINGETLRNRGTPSQPYRDLRGAPIGDMAEVWEWDRMVYPGRQAKGRRVRENVKVMHCPDGWYSDSGSADEPYGGAICATLLDPQWRGGLGGLDRARFNGFHDEHPVVWVIKVKRHRQTRTLRYCDPELPAEFRPQLVLGETSG